MRTKTDFFMGFTLVVVLTNLVTAMFLFPMLIYFYAIEITVFHFYTVWVLVAVEILIFPYPLATRWYRITQRKLGVGKRNGV